MNTTKRLSIALFSILLASIMAGCNLSFPAQTPIVVYVTPTSNTSVSQAATINTNASTVGSATVAITPVTPLPTFTQGAVSSSTTVPIHNGPTSAYGPVTGGTIQANTSSVTTGPAPVATTQPPTSTSNPTFGAVIGHDYTPIATFTPDNAITATPTSATLPPPATAGPSPTPGPVLRSDLMGIQVHPNLTDEGWNSMLDHIRKLGLGWVKVQVDWSVMETAKGQYSPQYRTLVLAIQRARSPQIKTLVSIVKAPDWARPADARGQNEDGPAANPQDFADFVRQLVIDVKPEFLDAVEVWNEPNLVREWHGAPITGAEYMKHFNAAYQAVIQAQQAVPSALRPNHRITVITAGVAPTGTVPGATLSDREWIKQLYASGLAKYGDDVAVGAHPYAWANPPEAVCCNPSPGVTGWYEHPEFYFRNTLDTYREIMAQNNDSNRKIWITEFGYATYDGLKKDDGSTASVNPNVGWENLIDKNQQADYVLRTFELAQKPPYYDFLGPLMLWNLNFATIPTLTDDGREEAGFSLLDQEYQPRPVYSALQSTTKQ